MKQMFADTPLPPEYPAAEMAEQGEAVPQQVDWAAWLKEFGPRLFLYARQQARCDADAEDIMQDALVQLVRAVEGGSFRGERSRWPGYVYTAIRHLAMDRGRREEVQRSTLQRFRDGAESAEYPEPWLQSSQDDEHLRRQVELLLRSLPAEFAEVVVLRIWGEYTFQQIADMTFTNLSTVTSRYRYAMQALRKKLSSNPLES